MSQALIHAADLNDNNTSAVDAGSQRQPVASTLRRSQQVSGSMLGSIRVLIGAAKVIILRMKPSILGDRS